MIYLRRGDRLPSVGMAQRVVNMAISRDNRLSSIAPLAEDGIFGDGTQDAIELVSSALNVRGRRRGVIDDGLWSALRAITRVLIVDVVDLCVAERVEASGLDPLQGYLPGYLDRNEPGLSPNQRARRIRQITRSVSTDAVASRLHYNRLLRAGGSPIALTDKITPFVTIARELESRSRDGGQIGLVRMQGHGSPASQGIAGSVLGWNSVTHRDLIFEVDDTREELDRMVRIGNMMRSTPSWSCLELHGCKIAARRPRRRDNSPARDGVEYVRDWAELVRRPVSAGVRTNDYGSNPSDYRIEGRVVTFVPGGASVADFMRSAPSPAGST